MLRCWRRFPLPARCMHTRMVCLCLCPDACTHVYKLPNIYDLRHSCLCIMTQLCHVNIIRLAISCVFQCEMVLVYIVIHSLSLSRVNFLCSTCSPLTCGSRQCPRTGASGPVLALLAPAAVTNPLLPSTELTAQLCYDPVPIPVRYLDKSAVAK